MQWSNNNSDSSNAIQSSVKEQTVDWRAAEFEDVRGPYGNAYPVPNPRSDGADVVTCANCDEVGVPYFERIFRAFACGECGTPI